jgi:hypothetical protein
MPVLVRDLPDDVHDRLVERPREGGQSLQQYLTAELTRLAGTPTLREVLARIETRQGGRVPFRGARDDLEAARAECEDQR